MTAFHPAVVALMSQEIAPQCSAQGYREAPAQFLHVAGVATSKLLLPVAPEGHGSLHPLRRIRGAAPRSAYCERLRASFPYKRSIIRFLAVIWNLCSHLLASLVLRASASRCEQIFRINAPCFDFWRLYGIFDRICSQPRSYPFSHFIIALLTLLEAVLAQQPPCPLLSKSLPPSGNDLLAQVLLALDSITGTWYSDSAGTVIYLPIIRK